MKLPIESVPVCLPRPGGVNVTVIWQEPLAATLEAQVLSPIAKSAPWPPMLYGPRSIAAGSGLITFTVFELELPAATRLKSSAAGLTSNLPRTPVPTAGTLSVL